MVADVAKPVDAADLKSASLHESAGSSPAVRTKFYEIFGPAQEKLLQDLQLDQEDRYM